MVKTTEFNVQTQMNYIVGNMSGFTAAYTGMDNLSALLSSLMTSYTTMAGTGRAAYLSLGAAISAVGLKSAEAFGEYQRGMNMVKAIILMLKCKCFHNPHNNSQANFVWALRILTMVLLH